MRTCSGEHVLGRAEVSRVRLSECGLIDLFAEDVAVTCVPGELFDCRLPGGRDHFGAGFAMRMGSVADSVMALVGVLRLDPVAGIDGGPTLVISSESYCHTSVHSTTWARPRHSMPVTSCGRPRERRTSR